MTEVKIEESWRLRVTFVLRHGTEFEFIADAKGFTEQAADIKELFEWLASKSEDWNDRKRS